MGNSLVCIGIILLGGAAAVGGCGGKACKLVGCSDGFSASVRSADGSFPSGLHRIEVLADSAALTYTFTFPLEVGSIPVCGGFSVMVFSATTCTDTRCDPIPGQFFETITVPGTPGQVHAWQYVDDAAILDAAAAPSYQDLAPNGVECGPVCRQASASWTLQ